MEGDLSRRARIFLSLDIRILELGKRSKRITKRSVFRRWAITFFWRWRIFRGGGGRRKGETQADWEILLKDSLRRRNSFSFDRRNYFYHSIYQPPKRKKESQPPKKNSYRCRKPWGLLLIIEEQGTKSKKQLGLLETTLERKLLRYIKSVKRFIILDLVIQLTRRKDPILGRIYRSKRKEK